MPGGFPMTWDVCNGTDIGTNTAASCGTALTATRGAYGAYAQLIASTAADCSWCELCFQTGVINNSGGAIKLAVGASGSEVPVLSNLVASTNGSNGLVRISFPICIPAGSRVAAAAQCFNGGGETAYFVNAQLYDGGFQMMEGIAGYDSLNFDTTNGVGLPITASASINTKGTYTQLTASTARDYCGMYIITDDTNGVGTSLNLLDIAIGGAGSELVIVPNWAQTTSNDKIANGFVPICIPAGTRIAARMQSTVASQKMDLTLQMAYL